jgi:CelD/BcsL family acetyltransferase involved in cellulose biosynthesis
MSLRVWPVETPEAFAAMAPLWSEMVRASGQTSPFLSHDWFACCWRAVEHKRRPEVLVIEESGGPIAIVPLMRWSHRLHGLPVRRLGFFACPDSPLLDVLAVGETGRALEALWDHLAARADWDTLVFKKLPATSATVKALEETLPGRLAWRRRDSSLSPYLTVSGTWEAFFRSRTQRFRKTCRSMENRIRRTAAVTVEEHRVVDPDGPIFAELMEVSRRSWKGPRGLAMATMPGMPQFFRELTRRASANGWLHLWLLRLDGRAVATEYQIGANGRRHALRADFDADMADLSPGGCLNVRIVQALFEGGEVHEYDMGPVDKDYKLRWATGTHESPSFQVYAPGPYGRFLHAMESRLVPLAKRWRDRVWQPCA